MADLEDEEVPPGVVPGDGAPLDRRAPAAGGLPPVDLAQGSAQEPQLGVDERPVVAAPKKAPPKVVRPDLPPLETDANRVVAGEPPAPPLSTREGLTPKQRAVADYAMTHPDASASEIARAVGVAQTTAAEALDAPKVRMYMSQYLDRAGATLQKSADVVAAAHDAVKETPVTWEGEIRDVHRQPDHKMRLDAAKLNMQAHGALDQEGLHVHQELHLTDEQLALVASGKARMSDFARTRPDAE